VKRDEDIFVITSNGTKLQASVAGRDFGSDLAVLRVEGTVETKATIVEEEARIGQFALALGRPNTEGIQTSLGVVSAIGGPIRTGRGGMLERYLRTDAIPYPGFSGGPLIDASGDVLGINTSGLSPGSSLVIPARLALGIADNLVKHGSIKRGFIGIRSQQVNLPTPASEALHRDQTMGLLLVGIEENSPAQNSELILGDIIIGVDGNPVEGHDDLLLQISGDAVGAEKSFDVLRGGEQKTFNVTIGEIKHEGHRHHRRRKRRGWRR
jgi:S1-C subfamily serine protease